MRGLKSISENESYEDSKKEKSNNVKKNNLSRTLNMLFISDYEEKK